jgi:hypothetical protein
MNLLFICISKVNKKYQIIISFFLKFTFQHLLHSLFVAFWWSFFLKKTKLFSFFIKEKKKPSWWIFTSVESKKKYIVLLYETSLVAHFYFLNKIIERTKYNMYLIVFLPLLDSFRLSHTLRNFTWSSCKFMTTLNRNILTSTKRRNKCELTFCVR